jgi:hypothetical protein
MKFISEKEYPQIAQVEKMLASEDKIIFTSNGKPTAIIIYTDESTLEDTLFDLRKLKAKRNLFDLQMQSIKNGTSNMTMDEINTEIELARLELNAKNSS